MLGIGAQQGEAAAAQRGAGRGSGADPAPAEQRERRWETPAPEGHTCIAHVHGSQQSSGSWPSWASQPRACPQAPTTESWTFRANSVTVNDSQDEVRDPIFGLCIAIPSCEDEPYTLNIGFRVKIGVAGSADAFVVNNRTDAPENVGEGVTVNLTGNAQNAVTWNGIKPLDVLDLLNSSNKLEVVGVYTWSSEEDLVGNGLAADGVAGVLEDALNATLAAGIAALGRQPHPGPGARQHPRCARPPGPERAAVRPR